MMMPASPDASSYPHGALSLSTGAMLRLLCVHKYKICSLFMRLIPIQALNLTASRAAKNQEPSKKALDKILRLKIKSDSGELAQKPDFKTKFSARLFKKAAI